MFKRAGLALGFTLIEMAIVLVVVGLLLSGGLLAVGPVINSSKGAQTIEKLDRLEQALTLYVIRYGCLPCPANGALGTVVGVAAGNAATYTGQCLTDASAYATCAITNGDAVVPWGTLGLQQADAVDGWGNLITYVVDGARALNNTSMVRTPPSGYTDGALEVRDATPGATVQITLVAAYVLVSHGSDGRGARIPTGQLKAAPDAGNTVQINNAAGLCTAATPCHQDTPYDIAGADHFDDIVRWRTAPLIIQSCGANACGNPE